MLSKNFKEACGRFGFSNVVKEIIAAEKAAAGKKIHEISTRNMIEREAESKFAQAQSDLLSRWYKYGRNRIRYSDFMMLDIVSNLYQEGKPKSYNGDIVSSDARIYTWYSGFCVLGRTYIFVPNKRTEIIKGEKMAGTLGEYFLEWRENDCSGTMYVMKGELFHTSEGTKQVEEYIAHDKVSSKIWR